MTDRSSSKPRTERGRLNVVTVLATILFGLVLGAIAWLVLVPEDAGSERAGPPAVTLALPPPTAQPEMGNSDAALNPEPATQPELAPQSSQQAATSEPAQPPAAAPEPEPPAVAPGAIVDLPAIVAEPAPQPAPAAPPPEPPAAAPSVAAPAPSAEPPPAPPQSVAVIPPPPPVYQAPERRTPAPAPDGLAPAPDPALVENTRDGPLPVIGKDGRRPWQAYARPFDASDKRPRVGLIISGLGQSAAATDAAIQRLPGAVTLAFAPYAKNLDQWIGLARAAGHEVLLTVPMEPIGYPDNDPGPHTLLTSISDKDNHERLLYLLSRFPGYVGVLNTMGARLTTAPQSLRPILEEINNRGLIFVDARSSLRSVAASQATEIGLPRAINNRFIDIKAARSEIDQRLDELERIAKEGGYALGIGSPYPVTIERVVLWAQELEAKGVALAPVSALVDKQPD